MQIHRLSLSLLPVYLRISEHKYCQYECLHRTLGLKGLTAYTHSHIKTGFAYIDFQLSHYYVEFIGRGKLLFEFRDLYVSKTLVSGQKKKNEMGLAARVGKTSVTCKFWEK